MELNEEDWTVRILFKKPIRSEQEISTVTQRLLKFLENKGVSSSDLSKVSVITIIQDRLDKLKSMRDSNSDMSDKRDIYVGIEIQNIPESLINSEVRLKVMLEMVFVKQNVEYFNITDTTCWVTFGLAATKEAIDQ